MLKQGARVDIPAPLPEPDRPSPLDLAVLRGDPALVRVLLENGANVSRCSPIIGSPLHVACADNILHRVEIMKVIERFLNKLLYTLPMKIGLTSLLSLCRLL